MAIATTGAVFLEPLPGGAQPTPLAAFIGSTSSVGDASGGSNVTTYLFSQDLLWVWRFFWANKNASTSVDCDLNIDQLAFGQSISKSFPLPTGAARAGEIIEIPRWLCRPDGQDVRVRFTFVNTNGLTFETGLRAYGFQKTVLRDFTAAQLLGFVL